MERVLKLCEHTSGSATASHHLATERTPCLTDLLELQRFKVCFSVGVWINSQVPMRFPCSSRYVFIERRCAQWWAEGCGLSRLKCTHKMAAVYLHIVENTKGIKQRTHLLSVNNLKLYSTHSLRSPEEKRVTFKLTLKCVKWKAFLWVQRLERMFSDERRIHVLMKMKTSWTNTSAFEPRTHFCFQLVQCNGNSMTSSVYRRSRNEHHQCLCAGALAKLCLIRCKKVSAFCQKWSIKVRKYPLIKEIPL